MDNHQTSAESLKVSLIKEDSPSGDIQMSSMRTLSWVCCIGSGTFESFKGGVSKCGWNGLGLDWMSAIGHAPFGDCKLIINYSAGNCFI